jgi:hypothetical protein
MIADHDLTCSRCSIALRTPSCTMVYTASTCCLHHHLFADQVDQTKIGFPLPLEASWLLTANEAPVAALEAALAEEGVRPRDRSL